MRAQLPRGPGPQPLLHPLGLEGLDVLLRHESRRELSRSAGPRLAPQLDRELRLPADHYRFIFIRLSLVTWSLPAPKSEI